ncbi:hypothetical protein ACHAXA_001197 [Cyclostephanos tholiformis]|uniref:Uncharacterized protein n=1 Tax=Cyclostephanos tholiformis TaxID=382380 RepID=A0ABD3R5E1_9STRA
MLFESTSYICTPDIHEALCCPSPIEDPCIICPNGTTVPDSIIPYASQGITLSCPDLIEYSKSFASSDDFCTPDADEALCCPPPAEDPCVICPNGATAADDYIPYPEIGTCAQLIEYSYLFESSDDWCTPDKDEAMCCPKAADNPCIICPNGATAGEDFLPYGTSGSSQTCKELIDLAKNFETGSELCQLSEIDESLCCPTPAENPCEICPAGITVTEYAVNFGDFSMTCDVLIEQMAHFAIDSDFCFQFGPKYEEACCPSETGDAITFIPVEETTTAATTVVVPDGTDTEVSGEVTTTSSTLASLNQPSPVSSTDLNPDELADLDLEDLTVTTPPASSSSSSLVSKFAVFAFIPIASALHVIDFV